MSNETLQTPIYIISFYPDSELKYKRRTDHQRQLQWLIDAGFTDIRVFSQNYDSADYFKHDSVHYFDIPTKNIAFARNKVLEHYYASDDETAFFADDDIILYDHAMGNKVFAEIENWEKDGELNDIDVASFLNPVFQPFNAEYARGEYDYESVLVFRRKPHFPTRFFWMRNLAKVYPWESFWFDEALFRPNVIGGEDNEFFIHCYTSNLGTYVCWNGVMKELGGTSIASSNASTWCPNVEDRRDSGKKLRAHIAEKYSDLGVEHVNGQLRTRKVKNNKPKIVVRPNLHETLDSFF